MRYNKGGLKPGMGGWKKNCYNWQDTSGEDRQLFVDDSNRNCSTAIETLNKE